MNNIVAIEEKEPSAAQLIITLCVAGFFSGLAIVGIYEITFETIKHNKAEELKQAVFQVLPGVTRLQKLTYIEGQLLSQQKEKKDERFIYGGYDDANHFVGYAIPGVGVGFQDTIRLLYGLTKSSTIVGMEILESRETPGLGDKIFKDAAFVANFDKLAIAPEPVLVKKGKKAKPNEVDAITGATISSKAVVKIINHSLKEWLPLLPKPGNEPAYKTIPVLEEHQNEQ